MKASKGVVEKTLFTIISVGSLVTLSSCAQPVTETPKATVPPIAETPAATIPPVAPTPVTTSPAATTANRNLAELAQAVASQGQFKTLTQAVQTAGLNEQLTTPGPYT